MAKSRTTKKKTAASKRTKRASKTARARSGGAKSTSRKATTRKTTSKAAAKKRKMTKKKTASKKKKVTARATKRATTKSAGKSTKKKTTKKKSRTATVKKKTTKKPVAKKKKVTTKKKKTRTKKAAGATAGKSVSSKAKTKGDAGAQATPKSPTTKKKRQTAADSRKRGRSVAEVASAAAADEQGYVFINGRRVRMISTAGLAPAKKTKPVVVEDVAEESEPIKNLKTKLSKKELNHYRDLLLIKRAEIVGDLSAMEAAALRSSGGEISHMPIHMADIGSDTYEQDFTLGLAESERRQLREIDDALSRIEDRTYGVCQMTGKDIPKARLDAKPWAKYTIEAARLVESQTQMQR